MKYYLFVFVRAFVLTLVSIAYIIFITPIIVIGTPLYFASIAIRFIRTCSVKVRDLGGFSDILVSTERILYKVFYKQTIDFE